MVAIVQTAKAAGSTVSFGAATTAGNAVIVCVGDIGTLSTPAVTAVTLGGAAGNFAALKTATNSKTTAVIWGDPNCAGGQTAIAVTLTSASHPVVIAYEISGVASSSILDQSQTGTGTGTSWSSGTTGTTTQAIEAWIGLVTDNVVPTGPGAPWTNTSQASSSTNLLAGEQVTTSTGTATYSGTSSSGTYAAAVITLLSSSSSSGSGTWTAGGTLTLGAVVAGAAAWDAGGSWTAAGGPAGAASWDAGGTWSGQPSIAQWDAGGTWTAAVILLPVAAWDAGGSATFGGTATKPVLVCSMSATAGSDSFGNAWPAGFYANTGLLYGGVIAQQSITAGILAAGAIDGYTVNALTVNSGTISASDVIISGLNGGAFAYSSGGTIVELLDPAASPWTFPPGVTSVMAEEWAAGGGGGGSNSSGDAGGGAGGGEYTRLNAFTGTPGHAVHYSIGAAGAGGGDLTDGTGGGSTVWDTTGIAETAHGGNGGHANFGLGGLGGTGNTTADAHFDGGDGATANPAELGGGGGGSGGTSSAGNDGTQSTGGPGSGAPAVAGGGPGGDGGYSSGGFAPVTGPGGGGGGVATGPGTTAGNGQRGAIRLTYTSASPQLIASIAGAATTDPVASGAVPEGIAADHVSVTSTGAAPSTPAGRCVLYYDGGVLYALGPSGTPVAIATT